MQREEWSHGDAVGTLRQTLQSPLFSHILTLQQSIQQLRSQVRPRPRLPVEAGPGFKPLMRPRVQLWVCCCSCSLWTPISVNHLTCPLLAANQGSASVFCRSSAPSL